MGNPSRGASLDIELAPIDLYCPISTRSGPARVRRFPHSVVDAAASDSPPTRPHHKGDGVGGDGGTGIDFDLFDDKPGPTPMEDL